MPQEALDVLAGRLVYNQTNGPEFESPVQTALWKAQGMDLFGMTAASECIIANNLGRPVTAGSERKVEEKMKYAVICIPTNLAAHLGTISHAGNVDVVRNMTEELGDLMKASVRKVYESSA